MNTSDKSKSNVFAESVLPFILVVLSLIAIAASFVLASSAQEYITKSQGFSAIIIAYLICSLATYFYSTRSKQRPLGETRTTSDIADIDKKLRGIEEASQYFSGSLNSADMFRLVSSRANDVHPFSTSVLLLVDRTAGNLRVVQASGENANGLLRLELPIDHGICGRCLASKSVQVERGIAVTNNSLPSDALIGFRSSAAIPLMRSGEVFAVLQLFSSYESAFDGHAAETLEAIGERVTPLIMSSLSFEKSRSNALTDPITDLPNERAFLLILENQIAESQRNPEKRPLTILAMDIKEFDELNSRYGHASGDRVLGMVAGTIKGQLRQMDFFARASNDEFLAILPTASDHVAEDVIARINTGLFSSKFSVAENETVMPELNFGMAAFGVDGDAAESLIRAARIRKQQAKAHEPHNVLWFPKEIIN